VASGPVDGDRRRLASELRRLREAGGLSGQRLGELLGWSQSKVTKIENGRTRPSAADVEVWAAATGASDDARAELAALAEAVATHARSWSSRHGTLASRNLEIAQFEREATSVQTFQPAVFPGLLQTADYARRVVSMLDVAGERDVAAAVAARVERQTVLYDQGRNFEFLLTEGALRWRPGPPELMLAQLDRLLSVMTLPNVAVGVLPQGRRQVVLHTNGFTIFDVLDDPFVLVETLTRELHLREDGDLAAYRAAFARAREAAASGSDAVALIRQVMAEVAGG
jgi:transcriptional regulator with XRE-family HTH domain